MSRQFLAVIGGVVLVTAVAGASTYRGPNFVAPGDAGSSRDDAADVKNPNGSGPVTSIAGSLEGGGGFRSVDGDYQDVYRIFVSDPSIFKISLTDTTFGVPDSMMFLFNKDGNPIMASDNTSPQNFNPILDNIGGSGGQGQFFDQPGIYYLAITSAPSQAFVDNVDGVATLLFDLFEQPFGSIGPAQGAENLTWTSEWTTPNPANFGDYDLFVSGVDSLPIPGPAGLAVLAVAGLVGTRRRRA